MKKDELIAFRDRELSKYYNELMASPGKLRVESAPVPPKTNQRLAIGGRRRDQNDYDLVIRVQNIAGRGITQAEQIMDRAKKEFGENQKIDYAMVRRITAPSQRAVAEIGTDSTFGTSRIRPISIGYSIGHRDGGPGTIAIFAKTADGIAAVSCNHVIARAGEAKPKDWIYQPGPRDLQADTKNRIGKLADYKELTTVGSNYIDAAYCILEDDEDNIETNENVIPNESEAPDAGKAFKQVIDPFDLELKNRVAKIGRTTGYTSEPIENVSIGIDDVTIEIPGIGNHRFDNMIEIEWSDGRRPFAKPGDSGSALYQEGSRNVFGLHVASGHITRGRGRKAKTTKVSYACPMKAVIDAYEFSLL